MDWTAWKRRGSASICEGVVPSEIACTSVIDSIHARRLTESRVRAHIVLPQITRPGLHLAHLCPATSGQRHTSTKSIVIAARPDDADLDRVATSAAAVPQDLRRTTIIGNYDINVAIVVEVTRKKRAPHSVARKAGPRLTADLCKPAPVGVLEEKLSLRVCRASAKHGGVVDDVPVHD